jgi:hypothetical protein
MDSINSSGRTEKGTKHGKKKMKRRALVYDFLCENVYNEHIDNPYIVQFAKNSLIKSFRNKYPNEWHSILNKNTLKKEITECYGIVNLVLDICDKLHDKLQSTKQIIFLDICSGKGYTSLVLYAHLPEWVRNKAKIIMLDKDMKMNLSHLETLNGIIEFHHLCIFPEKKNGTQRLINDLNKILNKFCKSSTNEVVCICIGVHLCIYLSEIFISTFNQMDSIIAMALSPCCVHETEENQLINEMCKNSSIFEDAHLAGITREVMQYMGWTMFLNGKIQSENKKMIHDELVLSDRNNFLIAYKQFIQS